MNSENQTKFFVMNKNNRFDKTGIFASSLCLLHCAALSVFLPLFSLNLPFIQDERLEASFLITAIAMGCAAFFPALRAKGRTGIGILGMAGLAGLIFLEFFCKSIENEILRFTLSLPFFAMLLKAHMMNIRVCKECASKNVLSKLSLFSPI